MKKLIKNYTTDIPTERTIAEIQQLLVQNGAQGIALEYDDSGRIKDIFFKIRLHEKELPFRLPAKPDKVYAAVFAGMQYQERLRQERMKKAEPIAWRICKTWLEAQITLITDRCISSLIGNLHIPSDLVVKRVTVHRKPPEVRICRLRHQSAVGTRPPSTSTPHWPACWARR